MSRSGEYLWRIRTASFKELLYRIRQRYWTIRLKNPNIRKAVVENGPLVDEAWIRSIELPEFKGTVDVNTAYNIPAGLRFTLNTPIDQVQQFEKKIRGIYFDNVPQSAEPDIRAVWEPARLQHVTLLLAWLRIHPEGENFSSVRKEAGDNLLKWLSENPFLTGPHYMSAMECGLRIPVFVYALILLPHLTHSEKKKLVEAIYRHGWWVSRRLSLFASRGNHTICECVGLVFAGMVFKHHPAGKSFLATGIKLLLSEAEHQILDDGGPAEQAMGYHRFVLDLYNLVGDFLQKNKIFDLAPVQKRLCDGEAFIEALQPCTFGDEDNGFAVGPGLSPGRPVVEAEAGDFITFDKAGYTVIKDGGVHMTLYHGPLGMPPLYNHGHADALSIHLSKNGTTLLIDPGTYRYNGAGAWRRYFKSTRAHNTVTVDGKDQAEQVTSFIWKAPYECRLLRREKKPGGFLIEASHDGYCRLRSPVLHFRKILYWKPDTFLIKDRFEGRGHHDFELNFHLGETFEIDKNDEWWRLDFGSTVVFLKVFEQVEEKNVHGETDPPFGWHSPTYGIKKPINVLSFQQEGKANEVKFTTAILISEQ